MGLVRTLPVVYSQLHGRYGQFPNLLPLRTTASIARHRSCIRFFRGL